MLSGQITTNMMLDAGIDLLDDLEPTLIDLMRRNMRLIERQRGVSSYSHEQKELMDKILENPEKFVAAVIDLSITLPMVEALREYAKQAELEIR